LIEILSLASLPRQPDVRQTGEHNRRSLQLQYGGMPAVKSTTVTITPARTVSQPMTTIRSS
jgi:hypothetical protein